MISITLIVIAGVTGVILYQSSQPVTFEGVITNSNNQCTVDGICSVWQAGNVIITGEGLSGRNEDPLYGSTNANVGLTRGQHVSVRALRQGSMYTLRACKDCYVR